MLQPVRISRGPVQLSETSTPTVRRTPQHTLFSLMTMNDPILRLFSSGFIAPSTILLARGRRINRCNEQPTHIGARAKSLRDLVGLHTAICLLRPPASLFVHFVLSCLRLGPWPESGEFTGSTLPNASVCEVVATSSCILVVGYDCCHKRQFVNADLQSQVQRYSLVHTSFSVLVHCTPN